MPKERKLTKEPKVMGAEITDDGCIIIEFNTKLYPHTAKCIFPPEVLLGLAEDYGSIPPKDDTDFPGVPIVTEEAMLEEDGEEEDGEKKNGQEED